MSNYTPGGISFIALTVLLEHYENGGDWPVIVVGARQQTVIALIERGMLRQKDSRFTTITRHGVNKLREILGLWADMLTRYETASIDKAVRLNAKKKTELARVACGRSDPRPDSVDTALSPEPAHAL